PAIAAGTALALMETLADFGVSSYFGIQTFTAGIYKAWLVMDNRIAAAQLATFLLLVVVVLLATEQRAQSRLRFSITSVDRHGSESQALRLRGLSAALAWTLCVLPVLFGFVLPVLFMLRALLQGDGLMDLPWARFLQWSINSVSLGGITALLAVGAALLLAAQARLHPNWLTRQVMGVVGLGYAVPGAVIVVGLLIPVGWVQATWPQSGAGFWLTATVMGLVWAYLVRFVAVALQSVQSGYARVPASLDDSARMLGTSGFALLRRVHWPLLKKPLAVATLLVLVDVMKELPATLVLRPFNTDTLAVMAYQLARDERLGEAALPSLALVLVSLLPVILLSRTLRRN
ncbi:MAG: ABC transporter permease subunit, partial [Sulfuritalea sp.]|nr:ABC transporter permease subunit [Sulfuritalea sp.]